MKKNASSRWWIIVCVMILLVGVLIWKTYQLTIVQGEEYNELSQSRRTKEIQIPAPRGNIYDRNGVLLAGTRTSFAVQGYKDDLLKMEKKDRNLVIAELLRFLERDGVDYEQEFPLTLNQFVYAKDEDYLTEKESPDEKVRRLLRENNLLTTWLSEVYHSPEDSDFSISPAARALTAFSLKGSALPIHANPDENFLLSYVSGQEYDELFEKEEITEGLPALDYLGKRVSNNENILTQVLSHPAARKLAFDLLQSKGLSEDLELAPVTYTYEEAFRQRKAGFHQRFPKITLQSSAKEDFVTLVEEAALDRFLESVSVSEENKFAIPAEYLINRLESMGVDSNLKYTISSDATFVTIEYAKDEKTSEEPKARLARLAKENHLLEETITKEEYKYMAEQAIFAEGLYPGIGLEEWTYGLQTNQKDFLEKYEIEKKTPAEAFEAMQKEYEMDPSLDPILQQGIMMVVDEVARPGNYAFWPVNVAYELSEDTVAKIEENIPVSSGFMISQQPIRYYPFGESASHILGYIGSIATEEETKLYVDQAGYLPNEVIGKTGVEQSFEDTLHGVSGKEVVLVDSAGNRTETLERVSPKAGNNLYLTIDIHLQQEAEKALKNGILAVKHGMSYTSAWGTSSTSASSTISSAASVSVDPQTGSLLELASYPMFDPNLFVTGISNSDWEQYQPPSSEDNLAPLPLLNLVTQTAVQPGSTWKPVVALSALEKGFDPHTQIVDEGFIRLGDRVFNNWLYTQNGGTEGSINLYDAIGVSNNYYFYILGLGEIPGSGRKIGVQLTVDDIEKTAKKLGLDQPTGLELRQPGEVANHIPSRSAKVELARTLLRNYLEENLVKFKKPEVQKEPKNVEQDIEQILKWSEKGADVSRTTLIDDLEALGYHAEEPLPDSYTGLADILKYTYFNQIEWTMADMMNIVIGQGQNAYTPITMCRVASIFAERGVAHRFTLVKEIRSADNTTVLYKQTPRPEAIDDPKSYFEDVCEGMRRSAEHNAAQFQGLPFEVGSKTGTAERGGIDPRTGGNYVPYAWNICFAPFEEPKIATVTFLPDGNSSINAVPISRDIVATWLEVPAQQEVPEGLYEGLKTYYPPNVKGETGEEKSEPSSESTE